MARPKKAEVVEKPEYDFDVLKFETLFRSSSSNMELPEMIEYQKTINSTIRKLITSIKKELEVESSIELRDSLKLGQSVTVKRKTGLVKGKIKTIKETGFILETPEKKNGKPVRYTVKYSQIVQ
jgi:hypothetical protein